jgi:hypothetical protein
LNQRLSDWASIAEVVSAVAIVLSLLYVGYQIRENTIEVRETNRQQLITRAMEATASSASPHISEVVAKVSEGANLSAVERTQYGYIVRTVLYDVQEAYLLNRVGRLDYEYWSTRASIILAYLAPQAARDIYHRDASIGALHAGFMQWLDSALEERYGN